MEIEMKYAIDSNEIAEKIWQDEDLMKIEEEGSREEILMKAAYFDTDDYVLSKNDIAMRVRIEGDRMFATLKWRGKNEGAMHVRGEINVPVDDLNTFLLPDISLFKESDIGQEVIRLVGKSLLNSIIETRFLRNRFRVDNGDGIMEVSVDRGEIITADAEEPICELEVELFSGDEDALLSLSEQVAKKYDLRPESRSKYSRGLDLLGFKK
ncbi:MAG: CYTH domain-containing protein [Eubacteriales bacterium]